jgi:hypothetical protein
MADNIYRYNIPYEGMEGAGRFLRLGTTWRVYYTSCMELYYIKKTIQYTTTQYKIRQDIRVYFISCMELYCIKNTIQKQYNTIQYNTIQYNTIQYKIRYDIRQARGDVDYDTSCMELYCIKKTIDVV